LFTLSLVLLGVGSAADAVAADPPPPPEDLPAVSAYVELVPSSTGSRAPKREKPSTRPLRPSFEAAIRREGGKDAPALKEITSSPAYGVPPRRPLGRNRQSPESAARATDDGSADNAFSAAIAAATEEDASRMLLLALILPLITGGILAAFVFERRRSRTAV
jgi:hypothetical protein